MGPTRRGLLTGVVAALAGCAAPGGGGGGGSETPTTSTPESAAGTTATSTASGTPTMTDDTTPDGELDLREANVTRVELARDGGRVTFDVTLFHDVRKSLRDFRSPSGRSAS